jgi:hypothetical protein
LCGQSLLHLMLLCSRLREGAGLWPLPANCDSMWLLHRATRAVVCPCLRLLALWFLHYAALPAVAPQPVRWGCAGMYDPVVTLWLLTAVCGC